MMRVAFVIVVLGLAILVSAAVYFLVQTGAAFVCVPIEEQAQIGRYTKTITEMDKVVELGLKLSTTLAGLGAALLIGLKSGLRLNLFVRCCIFFATTLFVQSALYAVWWRSPTTRQGSRVANRQAAAALREKQSLGFSCLLSLSAKLLEGCTFTVHTPSQGV